MNSKLPLASEHDLVFLFAVTKTLYQCCFLVVLLWHPWRRKTHKLLTK